MIRSNQYEAAFEAYLREQRTAYVAVDETRRALMADVSLKSMDFIVYSAGSQNLLIDVKGRKRTGGRKWENWVTVEDISALIKWQDVFGADFRSLLVFAYESAADAEHPESKSFLQFRKKRYDFYGVWVDDYRQVMKQRSPRWQTVWVPNAAYRECRFPLSQLLIDPSTVV
ncbi:HYExAFE family protein [Rubinisphaera italica]|uniref:Uncharacterized protein n=1 Tax=Rubinisphaera italica TaxID=2527969 RepID=A0A5C5XNA7_9PLAN|nr:HYExAFE family protein [Rubinisphaera italica]TWT63242.1 hypothetical protein Pan54_39950 [Rubinisphaera italica]